MKICDVLVFLCLMCYVLPILGEMSSLLDGTLKEGLQIIVLYYQVRKTLFLHPVQWRIQDFPQGGRQLPKVLLFFNFLPKTA